MTALAAIGGMKELKHGLQAVIDAKFPGKTVILPNCPDMPLVPVSELASLSPAIAGTLNCCGHYSVATEAEINAQYGVGH